jgi:transposase
MHATADIDQLSPEQIRTLAIRLQAEVRVKQALIDKLTHEMAILKRHKFAAASEVYTGERQRLLFETMQ